MFKLLLFSLLFSFLSFISGYLLEQESIRKKVRSVLLRYKLSRILDAHLD